MQDSHTPADLSHQYHRSSRSRVLHGARRSSLAHRVAAVRGLRERPDPRLVHHRGQLRPRLGRQLERTDAGERRRLGTAGVDRTRSSLSAHATVRRRSVLAGSGSSRVRIRRRCLGTLHDVRSVRAGPGRDVPVRARRILELYAAESLGVPEYVHGSDGCRHGGEQQHLRCHVQLPRGRLRMRTEDRSRFLGSMCLDVSRRDQRRQWTHPGCVSLAPPARRRSVLVGRRVRLRPTVRCCNLSGARSRLSERALGHHKRHLVWLRAVTSFVLESPSYASAGFWWWVSGDGPGDRSPQARHRAVRFRGR